MNALMQFGMDISSKRILWVNYPEKIKTLFESFVIHTDVTRLELQNRFMEHINANFMVREKKLFVHLARKILNLTFEEITELINVSKTSAHNLFSSALSAKDRELLSKLEVTYNRLLS
jgi:hypothetical protein